MLKDYTLTDRIFGNIIISFIGSLVTIFSLIIFNLASVPLTYFIFPSYFFLLSAFVELRVRKERKQNAKNIL
jgi:hypothetical protein